MHAIYNPSCFNFRDPTTAAITGSEARILESQPGLICLFQKFLTVMKESSVFSSLNSEMIKSSSVKSN
jgi:hypothetical protein